MGNSSISTNYRPISLAKILSIVFESSFAKKLTLEQFFDPVYNICLALLTVECKIYYSTCRESSILMAVLDTNKVCDRINYLI